MMAFCVACAIAPLCLWTSGVVMKTLLVVQFCAPLLLSGCGQCLQTMRARRSAEKHDDDDGDDDDDMTMMVMMMVMTMMLVMVPECGFTEVPVYPTSVKPSFQKTRYHRGRVNWYLPHLNSW